MEYADRECGRNREVRQAAVLAHFTDKHLDGLGVGRGFTEADMLHGPAGVFGLEVVLQIQGVEDVGGVSDRQLR